MPKLGCNCGYVHNLGAIPDDGWVLVRDADYDELLEVEARCAALSSAAPDTPGFETLIEAESRATALKRRMYECPQCGRLAVAEGDTFRSFVREPASSPYRS